MSLHVCAFSATPTVQAAEAGIKADWVDSIDVAERLARDVSFQDHRAVWHGDSARAALLNVLAEHDSGSALEDTAKYVIHLALGDYYFRDLRVAEAKMHWLLADSLAVSLWPTATIARRNLGWRLAILARKNGDLSIADSLEQVALADSSAEREQFYRYSYLRELAKIYIRLLRIEDAWKVHEQIAGEWRARPVGDPHTVIVALMDLAEGASKVTFTNFQKGRSTQDSAIQLGQEALAIARAYVATDAPIVGYVLNRLGDYHRRRGDNQLAEQCWQEAYDINLATRAEEDIETQGSISRIGNIALQRGEYARADRLLTKALELRRKTQGEEHQEVAAMLSNLAGLYRQTGRFAQAESLLAVALQIRRKALPADHPDIAANLNALGRVCFDQGRLSAAEPYWREARTRFESVLGGDDATTVAVLQNLADLYIEWERDDDALRMLREVVAVRREFLGEDHPAVINGTLQLAELHLKLGQLGAAEKALREARRLSDIHGDDPPLDLLLAEASLLSMRRQYPKSDSLIVKVISKRAAAFGFHSMLLIEPLQRLAANKAAQQELAVADSLLGLLTQIAAKNEMTSTSAVAEALMQRGDIQLALANTKTADSLYQQSFQISLSSFYDGIAVMPERLAVAYGQKLRAIRDRCLTLRMTGLVSNQSGQGVRQAPALLSADEKNLLSELVGTKSAILDVAFLRQHQLRTSADAGTRALIDSLNDTDMRLSRLYLTATRDTNAVGLDRQIRRLAGAKQVLEERLSSSREVGIVGRPRARLSFDELTAILGDDKASIDYVRFDACGLGRMATEPCYAAIVSTRGRVSLYQLGPAALIDSLVASLQRHFTYLAHSDGQINSEDLLMYLTLAQQIKDLIWSPFEALLPESGRVFISPDAALHLVSFAALPDSASRYLVEKYEFSYVNAMRDILQLPPASEVRGSLLAVGDPAFEKRQRSPIASTQQSKLAATYALASSSISRSLARHCPIASTAVAPLPASRYEVGAVMDCWSHTAGCPTTSLLDDNATEENFKRLAPGNVAIHLATHAFRWDSGCLSGVSRTVAREYPHLLTGLLLAGAAASLPESETGELEDGILVAEEIVHLNLNTTRFVVISACESGLGEISAGEGVFGLRRAFQLAGAESVISTLWEIPDQSTARLMRQFYQGVQWGLSSALHSAQRQALRSQREAGVPEHPYSWGAFVVYGN